MGGEGRVAVWLGGCFEDEVLGGAVDGGGALEGVGLGDAEVVQDALDRAGQVCRWTARRCWLSRVVLADGWLVAGGLGGGAGGGEDLAGCADSGGGSGGVAGGLEAGGLGVAVGGEERFGAEAGGRGEAVGDVEVVGQGPGGDYQRAVHSEAVVSWLWSASASWVRVSQAW